MKIPSINSALALSTCNRSAQTKNRQYYTTTFEGKLTPAEIRKYPLDKKLSLLLSFRAAGDIILLGKNFEDACKACINTVEKFTDIVKRILYIEQPNVDDSLAFEANSPNKLFCINLGDKKITVDCEIEEYVIPPHERRILEVGDTLIIDDDTQIKINDSFVFYDEYLKTIEDDDFLTLIDPKNVANKVYECPSISQSWITMANDTVLKHVESEVRGDYASKNTANDLKTQNVQQNKQLSFKDVGGMDSTIEILKRSILYPLKYPFAYNNMSVNKGIILYGKPGTGKTLVAEALAGESDAKFIKLCGTDLESKWVGETEENWRKIFEDAKVNQPSIIFIDEFDAIVKERGGAKGENHADKVVNQLLSLMSDLEKSSDNVFVIATTNRIDTIDPAVKRSGRFGKHIEIPLPDEKGLKSIYEIHTRDKKIDINLDVNELIKLFHSKNFTGADVKHVVNEAHSYAWIRNGIYEKMEKGTLLPKDVKKVYITKEDFDAALQDWNKQQTSKIPTKIGYY